MSDEPFKFFSLALETREYTDYAHFPYNKIRQNAYENVCKMATILSRTLISYLPV